jgi:hypothetical protein
VYLARHSATDPGSAASAESEPGVEIATDLARILILKSPAARIKSALLFPAKRFTRHQTP